MAHSVCNKLKEDEQVEDTVYVRSLSTCVPQVIAEVRKERFCGGKIRNSQSASDDGSPFMCKCKRYSLEFYFRTKQLPHLTYIVKFQPNFYKRGQVLK